MSLIRVNRHPAARDLRLFATLWLLFVGVAAGFAFSRGHTGLATGLALAALVPGVLGWVRPAAVRWLYLGATYVTFPIGYVVSHVVLAVVYYLVMTPIGCLMRLLGRDPLQRRFEPARQSYWEPRTTTRPPASYLRQH